MRPIEINLRPLTWEKVHALHALQSEGLRDKLVITHYSKDVVHVKAQVADGGIVKGGMTGIREMLRTTFNGGRLRKLKEEMVDGKLVQTFGVI